MDEQGRIVERGQSICRGDLYDFSLVVTRQALSAGRGGV
jgi:GntR family transcriptional regulator